MTLTTSTGATRSTRFLFMLLAAVLGVTAAFASTPAADAQLPTIELPEGNEVTIGGGILEVVATAIPGRNIDCAHIAGAPGLDIVTIRSGEPMTICVTIRNVGVIPILPPIVEIVGMDSGTVVVGPELTARVLYPGVEERLAYELVVKPRTDSVLEVRAESFDVLGFWVADRDPVGVDVKPLIAPFDPRWPRF